MYFSEMTIKLKQKVMIMLRAFVTFESGGVNVYVMSVIGIRLVTTSGVIGDESILHVIEAAIAKLREIGERCIAV